MESIRPALPEFNPFRVQRKATPGLRERDFAPWEGGLLLFPFAFEDGAVGNDFTLVRSPGGQAASAGSRLEIRVGFLPRNPGDATGHTHLAFEGAPIKHQRGLRIFGKVARFSTSVVGKKNETALIDPFK